MLANYIKIKKVLLKVLSHIIIKIKNFIFIINIYFIIIKNYVIITFLIIKNYFLIIKNYLKENVYKIKNYFLKKYNLMFHNDKTWDFSINSKGEQIYLYSDIGGNATVLKKLMDLKDYLVKTQKNLDKSKEIALKIEIYRLTNYQNLNNKPSYFDVEFKNARLNAHELPNVRNAFYLAAKLNSFKMMLKAIILESELRFFCDKFFCSKYNVSIHKSTFAYLKATNAFLEYTYKNSGEEFIQLISYIPYKYKKQFITEFKIKKNILLYRYDNIVQDYKHSGHYNPNSNYDPLFFQIDIWGNETVFKRLTEIEDYLAETKKMLFKCKKIKIKIQIYRLLNSQSLCIEPLYLDLELKNARLCAHELPNVHNAFYIAYKHKSLKNMLKAVRLENKLRFYCDNFFHSQQDLLEYNSTFSYLKTLRVFPARSYANLSEQFKYIVIIELSKFKSYCIKKFKNIINNYDLKKKRFSNTY